MPMMEYSKDMKLEQSQVPMGNDQGSEIGTFFTAGTPISFANMCPKVISFQVFQPSSFSLSYLPWSTVIYPKVWVNYNDLTVLPNPGIMVYVRDIIPKWRETL
jgi:hypothetical protein